MKKRALITLLCVILMNQLFVSADNMEMYRYIPTHQLFPPSPDAASLGKYGDYPVSLATGLVDISIPLFEIGTKRIKLPISLSYHASGITVEEIASSVGLGWTINAGGCIAVSVKGREDFVYDGFVFSSAFKTTEQLNSISDNNIKINTILSLYGGLQPIDMESDVYSYNFNGYSGQFRYNHLKQIVPLIKGVWR